MKEKVCYKTNNDSEKEERKFSRRILASDPIPIIDSDCIRLTVLAPYVAGNVSYI